jgi:glycerophosphoryl diester phosphodiesterase
VPVRAKASAHRGDQKTAPESTVPAIRLAAEKGAHQIEFDVQMTRDGQLVCIHDATVDRTTDGLGGISELTFDEVRALDAGGWKAPEYAGVLVPTYREVLEAAPPPVLLNVHLRDIPGLVEEVVRQTVDMDRVGQCVLACSAPQLEVSRRLCPELRICSMDRQGPPDSDYADRTIHLGAEFIQIWGWDDTMPEVVARLHEAGVTVNYFGTEAPDVMRRLVNADVDYILTDDLDLCLSVLGEYGVEPLRERHA